jgi:hypothetical protein
MKELPPIENDTIQKKEELPSIETNTIQKKEELPSIEVEEEIVIEDVL